MSNIIEESVSRLLPKEETPLLDRRKAKDTALIPGYESASRWSSLVFHWMFPLLLKGNEKDQLDPLDLKENPLPIDCTTNEVLKKFDLYWEEEKEKSRSTDEFQEDMVKSAFEPRQPSLTLALAKAFGADFARAGILKLFHDLLIFVGPVVLSKMIGFFYDEKAALVDGILLAVAVTISQMLMSVFLRHYFFECYLTGLRIRTAIISAVYRKALFLAASERYRRTTGEITNLVSVDAQRLQDLTTYLHAIWYSVLQIILSIWFLWKQLGPSCLGGVAVILIIIPLTKYVAQWMGQKQKRLMLAKDARVEVNNEVLGSMKVIKVQAWEQPFQSKIEEMRSKELSELMAYFVAKSVSTMVYSAVPLLVSLATFSIYVLLGNKLDVASALTSLALFDILRFPLFMFPQVMNNVVEATVALSRVASFLLCEEHKQILSGNLTDVGISISNASFVYESKRPRTAVLSKDSLAQKLFNAEWEIMLLRSQLEDSEKQIKYLSESDGKKAVPLSLGDNEQPYSLRHLLCLRRINFECSKGGLIAVVGSVGSGKTSFINAILGEVRALSGSVFVKGRVAYFAQNPFIISDTLKANILFGRQDEPYDEQAYKNALSVCALEHDLTILPGGDACEIGEKGITLSGGQKARIAMARAVYDNADIYLLDDPLAAVDAHVGKHLFQKCIVEKLLLGGDRSRTTVPDNVPTKNRIVILVTNALQYLRHPMVDQILVLSDGAIQEAGTYDDLSNGESSLFTRSLKSFQQEFHENDLPNTKNLDLVPSLSSSSLNAMGLIGDDSDVAKIVAPFDGIKPFRASVTEEFVGSTSGALTTDELLERDIGEVTFSVYLSWAKAAGGTFVFLLIIFSYAAVEVINVLSRWWLTYWSFHGAENTNQLGYLFVYAAINVTAVFAMFARLLFVTICGLRASRTFFSRLLDTVLKAPMAFFDTTPIGRIVNRFSKDMYTVDEQLVATLMGYLSTVFSVISVILVISSASPFFLICLLPMLIFYSSEQKFFTRSYRELKRLDSVARSPLYSSLGETLDGIATIRAYSTSHTLMKNFFDVLDSQQNAYFLTFSGQCWLAMRLELLGTVIIAFACLFAIFEHKSMAGNKDLAALCGLAISYAFSVTQALNWTVRMSSDLEANMIALERIEQYCKIEPEAERVRDMDKEVSKWWPSQGEIIFNNVKLRYRPGLPLVLKGLDFVIPAQSKVGVVGRTGAGKSSLLVALLRIAELESGSILIDGIDVSAIGVALLRTKIATIPQDPTLFSGTIRSNVDPFNEYSDDRLNGVLRRVGLFGSDVLRTDNKDHQVLGDILDNAVFEGGSNFSVGQRQLIVIARALLREANIVILDEATASVDANTDARIQRVMRTEFKRATCITIAHRINTIMDSTHILVMDNGRVSEFDSPSTLLAKGGLFKDLVDTWEKENK